MKVAITAQGTDMSSPVDPHFGRAKYFLVADTDGGQPTVHDNAQNVQAIQGAGVQAGQTVVGLGVQAVVTGNVGPKAFRTLTAGGVKVYTGASGTVAEALEALKAGTLSTADKATVEGHWV